MSRAAAVLVGLLSAAPAAGDDAFVPFVIPARPNPKSLIAFPPAPAVKPDGPRVTAGGGHFHLGGKRFRAWGVNLSFGANFPTHADAEVVAARLAAAGINSVRHHHMDTASWPRGIWDRRDPSKLSDEALDRLDYFIDRLARRGIVSNLNLHVGRSHARHLKLPDAAKLRNYDKVVGLFVPALIAAQKAYARELLTRVNRYRKVRYADDPAVAFVEITNENSLFMWGAERTLTGLPPYYARALRARYNAWLKDRYRTAAGLRAAWGKGAEPLGKDLLSDGGVRPLGAAGPADAPWRLEAHGRAAAKAARGRDGLRVEIAATDGVDWHIQLNQPGVGLTGGRYYTLSFRARADRPREIGYNVGQAHQPWKMLGLSRAARLTKAWTTVRAGFVASADDDNARVNFVLGGDRAAVEIAEVRLRPGGRVGLGEQESLEAGTVAVFGDSQTRARLLDRMRFLAETEKDYFDGMRQFIRDELGCRALVTGTIVFGPLGLYGQSDMDYIDGHAYWQHPRFPGKPWDMGDWTVERRAMVDHPDESPLFDLAAQRLAGKPYTVSEYNHPAPNDFQAECVPMIAAFAAAQDWDGVWLYSYCHRTDDWDRRHFDSFFDIDANPAKWGFVPAGTVIFREAGIPPARTLQRFALGGLDDLVGLHRRRGRDMAAIVSQRLGVRRALDWLNIRVATTLSDRARPRPTTRVRRAKRPLGWLQFSEDRPWLFTALGPMAEVELGDVPGDHPWMFFRAGPYVRTMTALDGRPLGKSRRILIALCGRCENSGMKFSKDRRTVGPNWGRAPVRIEPRGERLFGLPGEWPRGFTCYALAPDGTPKTEVPIDGKGDEWVSLSPKYKTMWYLLTREAGKDE